MDNPVSTPDDLVAKERQAFEAWAQSQGWKKPLHLHRSVVDGRYSWQALNTAWDVWQARASLTAHAGEPTALHGAIMNIPANIPEHLRLTSWTVTRDLEKEAAMFQKVMHARKYYAEVIAEFDRTHELQLEAA